jgi:hypothetical protein
MKQAMAQELPSRKEHPCLLQAELIKNADILNSSPELAQMNERMKAKRKTNLFNFMLKNVKRARGYDQKAKRKPQSRSTSRSGKPILSMNTGELRQSILSDIEALSTPRHPEETHEEREIDAPLFNMPFKGDPRRVVKFFREFREERKRRQLMSPVRFLRKHTNA